MVISLAGGYAFVGLVITPWCHTNLRADNNGECDLNVGNRSLVTSPVHCPIRAVTIERI